MPTPLTVIMQVKPEVSGAKVVSAEMNRVRQSFIDSHDAAVNYSQSLSSLKNIVVGGVLALPLAGFIKEALQSEEVTARFSIKLRSMGQDAGAILPKLEGMSDQIHAAGFSQTQFIEAMSKGSTYFKSMDRELSFLNTAIGMTKMSGVDLATAFQQLGMVQMGYTRIARQYGVSMHSEIHSPTEKAAKILEEMRMKMEPLAKSTGTAAEAMKTMGVTISDAGEKLGGTLTSRIGDVAKSFNSLSDGMKETVVIATTMVATGIGLTLILAGIGKAAVGAGLGLKTLVTGMGAWITVAFAGAAILEVMANNWTKWGENYVKAIDKENGWVLAERDAIRYTGQRVSIEDDLMAAMQERAKVADALHEREKRLDLIGQPVKAGETVNREAAIRLEQSQIEAVNAYKEKYGMKTDQAISDEIKKLQMDDLDFQISQLKGYSEAALKSDVWTSDQKLLHAELYYAQLDKLEKEKAAKDAEKDATIQENFLSLMADGYNKSLAMAKEKTTKEIADAKAKYVDYEATVLSIAAKGAAEEVKLRMSEVEKRFEAEKAYDLMSKSDREKFDKTYYEAKKMLEQTDFENLSDASEQVKALFTSNNEAVKKAVDEWQKTTAAVAARHELPTKKTDTEIEIQRTNAFLAAQRQQDEQEKMDKEKLERKRRFDEHEEQKSKAWGGETGKEMMARHEVSLKAPVEAKASSITMQNTFNLDITKPIFTLVKEAVDQVNTKLNDEKGNLQRDIDKRMVA